MRDLWERYDSWSPANLVVLHEAAGVIDTLAALDAALAETDEAETTSELFPGPRPSAHRMLAREPLIRLQSASRRSLVILLRQLDLPKDE